MQAHLKPQFPSVSTKYKFEDIKKKTYSFCKTLFAELDVKTAEKKYLSSRCRHTSSNPIFHFFYTIQLWGHKEKTVAASGTGRKKKGSWALSWHRGIFSLQDYPTHVFANLVHCLDINFTPFCCSAFPTVLTSTPPLYVLAADKHCEHLLHKMSGSWYLSSRCRDTTSNRIFSTNHKFEDKKE